MSIKIYKERRIFQSYIIAALLIFASCNKDIPGPTAIVPENNNGTTSIGAEINTNPNYSIFKAAATRVGALADLSDANKSFTVFLPDNNAFIASGIPSEAVIAALPITSVGGIVNYAIIPGEQLISTDASTNFPNVQLPSAISIGLLPGTPVPLKLTTFPSKRATGFWDNNIPVITPDLKFQNGVIHVVAGIVAPPGKVLKEALYSNPDLTYFKAAVERADSGQTGLKKFDSLLSYAVTNMTVLAPNDAAFKTLIYGTAFGYATSQGAPPVVANSIANGAVALGPGIFTNPAFSTLLPASTVRGLIAYHLLATPNPATGSYEPNIRVFSVNFPPASATPFFVKTLVNSSFAPHPGIIVNATFTGPFVTDLKFTGLGTFPPGGAFFSGAAATAVSKDNHAVNGVYYVIDKVLLPQ